MFGQPKLVPLLWKKAADIEIKKFLSQELVAKKPHIFDDGFFDRAFAKVRQNEKTYVRLILVYAALLAILLLAEFGWDGDIGWFDASFEKIKKNRLIFLAILGTLDVLCALFYQDADYRRKQLKELFLVVNGAEFEEIYNLKWGGIFDLNPTRFAPEAEDNIFPTWVHYAIALMFIFFLVVVFGGFLLVWILGVIYLIIQEISCPSLTGWGFWIVLAYTLACFVLSSLFYLLSVLPLPYKDYRFVMELSELKKADPSAYEDRIREFMDEARSGK